MGLGSGKVGQCGVGRHALVSAMTRKPETSPFPDDRAVRADDFRRVMISAACDLPLALSTHHYDVVDDYGDT